MISRYIKLMPKSAEANPVPNAIVNSVVRPAESNRVSSSEIAFVISIKDSSGSPLVRRGRLVLRKSQKFLIKVNESRIVIK